MRSVQAPRAVDHRVARRTRDEDRTDAGITLVAADAAADAAVEEVGVTPADAVTWLVRDDVLGQVDAELDHETQLGHIVVAEGVLVGDLKTQNALANEEGSIGLRR